MIKDKIIRSVKVLPPLNENIQKIYAICSNENSSLKDLSTVIEKDPMLTANILKSANSPLYGFSREITNISHAINLFGMTTVKGFAIASAAKNSFKLNLDAYGIGENEFLNISTTQNSIATSWLKNAPQDIANIVIPASFLLEIGKVVIASELYSNNMHKQFKEKLSTFKTIEELKEFELEFIGITSEEVAFSIFDNWKLDRELAESILYSANPKNAPDELRKASEYLFIIKHLVNIFYILDDEFNAFALLKAKECELDATLLEEVIAKQKSILA